MAQTGDRNDPYSSFNFLVEIDGLDQSAIAGFSEVSGLTNETDIIEYREGSEDITVRKLPGMRNRGISSESGSERMWCHPSAGHISSFGIRVKLRAGRGLSERNRRRRFRRGRRVCQS